MNGNLGSFLPIILVILYGLFAQSRAAAKKARPPAGAAPKASDAPEASERTRRVREEVLRKIEERRRQAAPPVVVQRAAPPPADVEETAEIVERQRRIAEQIRTLDAERIAAQNRAAPSPFAPPPPISAVGAASDVLSNAWLLELRDPKLARRAIVLREVLGTPVGLR